MSGQGGSQPARSYPQCMNLRIVITLAKARVHPSTNLLEALLVDPSSRVPFNGMAIPEVWEVRIAGLW